MIPYTTDAPIYHLPIATGGLIVLNTVIFFLAGDLDAIEPWMLATGAGIHPIQWLTHNYLHAHLVHLIGNMIFLWAYGIVVEGKLGWWRFLLLYNGIGILHGAALQIAMLATEPSFLLGASAIIFGLLAICMVWAPKNEVTCVVFWRFVPDVWEIPYVWVGVLDIGSEFLEVAFHGLALSSALAHLSGAIWGLVLGAAMVKLNWVDCENWDLFAVMAGRQGKTAEEFAKLKPKKKKKSKMLDQAVAGQKRKQSAGGKERAVKTAGEPSSADKAANALARVQKQIELGDPDGAIAAYDRAARTLPGWPPDADLRKLIGAFSDAQAWEPAVRLMRDYVRLYPDTSSSDRVRLRLAQVLAFRLASPTKALRVLDEAQAGTLSPDLVVIRDQIAARARRLQEEGEVLEIDD
jgi:membrane associated rhomboid family serine protease